LVPEADRSDQAGLPPRRDQVAVVAVLDGVGLTVTAIAAVVLAVTDVTGPWRVVALVALALAVLAGVVTTVVFVSLFARRRTFVTNVQDTVSQLESRPWKLQESQPTLRLARSLRRQAFDLGEAGLLARLDTAIENAPFEPPPAAD
jgi:hypothetical protein